jgi:signal transduction histidine kinase/PAS domain-containing protein
MTAGHITSAPSSPIQDEEVLGLKGPVARYAAAFAASALALILTYLARGYLGERVFMFAFGAVAVSGALGLGPGVLAALICVLGVDFLFLPPARGLGTRPADLLALATFFLVSLFISGMAARLRKARLVAEDKRRESDRLRLELAQQTEKAASSEAFNRGIIESLTDQIVVHDSDWRFQFINEPAMRMFRTSKHHLPSSLIGQNLWELYPDIVDTEFGVNIKRAARERVPVSFQAYYPERGEWSDLTCYPLPNGGLLTVWKNITQRKQSEEAQRYLAEASALLGKSLDYEETLSSLARMVIPELADWCRVDMLEPDGTVRLLAVTHSDPEKEKWARELVKNYPQDMSASAGLPNVLRTGEAEMYPEITEEMLAEGTRDSEYLQLLKTVRFRGVVIAPIVSNRGVLGALTLVSAESRRKYTDADKALAVELGRRAGMAVENARIHNAEKAARAAAVNAQHAAEEANAAKSQFLAFMSHELRTPLNAISGYVDLILAGVHGPVSGGQRDALERVKRSQRALLGLINNVLNFVRLDAGHVDLNITDTPALDILKEVEPLVTPQLEAKGLEYEFVCDNSGVVHADPEKTQQILLNLLSNAIKFTDRGGSVTVECAEDGDMIEFRVHDTGCGIAADKLTAVFEPFVQLDRTLKSGHEGTGLGLAISRDLAIQMNGSLSVDSELGKGCTFSLLLPAMRD